ncbi:hypothetical protein [Longimicrobium sp.]|uniref:hypothetical protein n=1 Tax=Longimicrobium sp. TaxID=2029185 RepID=UPI002E31DEB2|nr:hypothetical protein [Longimicrobium sp.]HEX6040524.1 hypothetical protein [Longimicrobium sp.]
MRRLFIAALVALAACGTIKDEPLTESTLERVRESTDLTERDRGLLADYMARTAFARMQKGDTTANFFDPDVTVGEAIEAQRLYAREDSLRRDKEKREREAARQRRDAELARARALASVTVTGKRKHPRSTEAMRFSDHAALSVAVSNTGDRPIAGIKGRLVVRDLFDDPVIGLEFKHDDALAPGARATVERFYEINPYIDREARLYATDFEKLKVTWEPRTILFADGTRLDLPEPEPADPLADLLRLP